MCIMYLKWYIWHYILYTYCFNMFRCAINWWKSAELRMKKCGKIFVFPIGMHCENALLCHWRRYCRCCRTLTVSKKEALFSILSVILPFLFLSFLFFSFVICGAYFTPELHAFIFFSIFLLCYCCVFLLPATVVLLLIVIFFYSLNSFEQKCLTATVLTATTLAATALTHATITAVARPVLMFHTYLRSIFLLSRTIAFPFQRWWPSVQHTVFHLLRWSPLLILTQSLPQW